MEPFAVVVEERTNEERKCRGGGSCFQLWFAAKSGVHVTIVWLVRILGSHPSDPGSSPGGGILFELREGVGEHVFPPLLSSVLGAEVSEAMQKSFCCRFGGQGK